MRCPKEHRSGRSDAGSGERYLSRHVSGQAVLDLDYAEDSNAETDMNVVQLVEAVLEIQGTAEGQAFSAMI